MGEGRGGKAPDRRGGGRARKGGGRRSWGGGGGGDRPGPARSGLARPVLGGSAGSGPGGRGHVRWRRCGGQTGCGRLCPGWGVGRGAEGRGEGEGRRASETGPITVAKLDRGSSIGFWVWFFFPPPPLFGKQRFLRRLWNFCALRNLFLYALRSNKQQQVAFASCFHQQVLMKH